MNQLNRIKRINMFLKEFKFKTSYLQDLLDDSYKYYQQELKNEYLKISKHPYPNEVI